MRTGVNTIGKTYNQIRAPFELEIWLFLRTHWSSSALVTDFLFEGT